MATAPALDAFRDARVAATAQASLRASGVTAAGLVACHQLTELMDAALVQLAETAGDSGVAVVAVGGYGRSEQARHSDIDVMLLAERPPALEATNAVLYPLWDAGLKVGHSVRTRSQALVAGREQLETLTALLDARLVAGDAAVFAAFEADLRKLARQRGDALRAELATRRLARARREPWQLQEPDLKGGRGGLRDVQSMHWLDVAAAPASGANPPALPYEVVAAQEVLLATRNALHCLEERPNDRFRRDLAPPVAELLGVDRSAWVTRLLGALRVIDAAASARLARAPRRRRWWQRGSEPTVPRSEPIGAEAVGAGTELDRLLSALNALGPTGDGSEGRPSHEADEGEPPPLDPLPDSPWLHDLLPEWSTLRCLPHVSPVHRHPVDTHSARTVAEVLHAAAEDTEGTGTPQAAAALGDRPGLLLAALVHDIGKGHEGDHSAVGAVIVERFASRARLDAEATRRLVTAVQHHLLLPTVAVRRDIADPQVIRETAEIVGDARTLHLLYLLAVADARATGPDVWSAWKAQLMRALYLRVLDRLSASEGEASPMARDRERVLAALANQFPAAAVERHLDQLPESYLLSTPPEEIGTHLELIARAEADPGRTAVIHQLVGDVERLTLATPDRPGILSRMAGTLAAHNVSVLGGVAYTRDDGVAIDVYHVADALGRGLDEQRWTRVLEAVPAALAGEFPIEERLTATRSAYASRSSTAADAPPIGTSINVDNLGSSTYTIVEVVAADRIGLLYAITTALHSLALDVHLAKVDTVGREVVDAFYVLRENGRRVEAPDETERLRRRVAEAVSALDGDA